MSRAISKELTEKIEIEAIYAIKHILQDYGIVKLDSQCYYLTDLEANYFIELQEKIEKLEELTKFKADDYEWETTTVRVNDNEPKTVSRKLRRKNEHI